MTATPGSATPTGENEIRAVCDAFTNSVNAGDFPAWANLWERDATAYPPASAGLHGRASILAAAATVFADWAHEMRLKPEGTTVTDLFAFMDGHVDVRSIHRTEERARYWSGNFLAIFRREPPVGWKVLRLCITSSVPDPSG